MRELQKRQRQLILSEVLQVQGLMPLLMKPRNGQRWTAAERKQIVEHLRHLSTLSSYVIVLVLPGAPITLPLLAWWLDRRRNSSRPPAPAAASKN
ncbi:MAG: hypothetical protein ACREUA_07585 [Burkholderiales bacterium]